MLLGLDLSPSETLLCAAQDILGEMTCRHQERHLQHVSRSISSLEKVLTSEDKLVEEICGEDGRTEDRGVPGQEEPVC